MVKKIFVPMIVLCLIVALFAIAYVTEERDPAFLPHPTTFNGEPAFGRLHRPDPDGTQYYTFYRCYQSPHSGVWIMAAEIITVPVGEATKLH